jgi:hypothetical protein
MHIDMNDGLKKASLTITVRFVGQFDVIKGQFLALTDDPSHVWVTGLNSGQSAVGVFGIKLYGRNQLKTRLDSLSSYLCSVVHVRAKVIRDV